MQDLCYYLTAMLYDEFYEFPEDIQQICSAVICTAVPLLLFIGCLVFCIFALLAFFDLVRGEKMTFSLVRSFGDIFELIFVSEIGLHLAGFAAAAISAALAWRLLKGAMGS